MRTSCDELWAVLRKLGAPLAEEEQHVTKQALATAGDEWEDGIADHEHRLIRVEVLLEALWQLGDSGCWQPREDAECVWCTDEAVEISCERLGIIRGLDRATMQSPKEPISSRPVSPDLPTRRARGLLWFCDLPCTWALPGVRIRAPE